MSKNLLDVMHQNKKIQDSMINNKNKIVYPQIKPFKMGHVTDTTHIGTNLFKYELQPRMDFGPIYGFLNNYKKVEKDVSLAKTATDISIDKHFRIEHIKPISEIPIAYFQYKMKDRTINDIRTDNFRHEMGTKTEFHSLLEQEKTGELLEDIENESYTGNLRKVLSDAKTKFKNKHTVPTVALPAATLPVATVPAMVEGVKSEGKTEHETKKLDLKKDDSLDKIMNTKIFPDQDESDKEKEIEEEFSSPGIFQYKLDVYLDMHFTQEVVQLIKDKIQTGTDATKYKDKSIKAYVQRQLKNIHNQEERLKNKNKMKMQSAGGKGFGTLDSRRYEKTEEEVSFERQLQRELKIEDENTNIASHYFDFHEKDDEKTRIG